MCVCVCVCVCVCDTKKHVISSDRWLFTGGAGSSVQVSLNVDVEHCHIPLPAWAFNSTFSLFVASSLNLLGG